MGGEELLVVECKAEAGDKPAYVRKFYTETVPAYIRSKKSNGKIRECRAEIWTTRQVGLDAQQTLEQLKLNPLIFHQANPATVW